MNTMKPKIHMMLSLLMSALLLVGSSIADAADITASAKLSSPSTVVGRPVQLTLSITGTREVGDHPEVHVDGLEISPFGRSTQFQMHNFDVQMMVDLTYQVLPLREGTYTIPPIEIRLGRQTVRTQPITLTVAPGGQPPATTPDDKPAEGNSDLVFAELIVPKSSAFVGETVPIEIRLYFDSRLRYQIEGLPELDTASFTMKAMPEPRREQRTLHGRPYDVIVFNTALTPLKPGKLTVGPVHSDVLVQSPVQRRSQPQSPFDAFDSLFDDPFFGGAFQRMQTQRVRVAANPVEMEVKDVPTQGRPASFDGAVGNFAMETSVDLRQTSVGAPLTIRAVIRGRGDFDRVSAPKLSDTTGWRSYPPSSDFQADDTLGISGAKTFQILVIPDEVKSELPPFEFSYFDPDTEEFKTLRSGPIPISVAPGAASPQTQSSPAATTTSTPSPATSPEARPSEESPETTGRDILHILTRQQTWVHSFVPLYQTRTFWLAQGAAFALLVLSVGVHFWWRKVRNANRLERLHAERSLAIARARATSTTSDDATRLQAAVTFLREATALHHGIAAPMVDATTVINSRPGLDTQTTIAIREIFARHDEMAYASAPSAGAAPDHRAITQVLDAITRYDKHHEHQH